MRVSTSIWGTAADCEFCKRVAAQVTQTGIYVCQCDHTTRGPVTLWIRLRPGDPFKGPPAFLLGLSEVHCRIFWAPNLGVLRGRLYWLHHICRAHDGSVYVVQGQSEAVSEQLNEEEQLLVISRLHQVSLHAESWRPCAPAGHCQLAPQGTVCTQLPTKHQAW